MARLIEWENDCKELAKLEKQPLSDLTKRTTLKAMLPPDLLRDLERDSSLKPWSEAWKFVLEQVTLRKDWKSGRNLHNNDMDVDVAEEDKGQGEDPVCKACEEGDDLATMKGGGTAKFQGHCDYCWIFGNKKADCHKLTRDLGKGDGKDGGKGKGKDIGKGKGKDGGKGGWRPKGGYQPKGGWQQKGGGGKNGWGKGKGSGIYSCIDGDGSERGRNPQEWCVEYRFSWYRKALTTSRSTILSQTPPESSLPSMSRPPPTGSST